jgi:anti-sigma factor RsiW
MTSQDLPTYLRGHSISPAELDTAPGTALLRLCQSATADGRLSPEELEGLRQWLAADETAAMPAGRHLRSIVSKVLADGRVTPDEYQQVLRAVESVLPLEARLQALAARQAAEAADAAATQAVRPAGSQRILGLSSAAVARIGLTGALLALLGVFWLSR